MACVLINYIINPPLDIKVQTITLLQQFSQHNFLNYNHGIVPEEFSWILVKPIFRENFINTPSLR